MATPTQEAEYEPTIIEVLDLKSEEGDDLPGDVNEAIVEAKRLLKKLNLSGAANRLGTIQEGLKNWERAVSHLPADEGHIRTADAQRAPIRDTLNGMEANAERLTEILLDSGPLNDDTIEHYLDSLSAAVENLNSFFPDARPPRRQTSYRFTNGPAYVNSGTFGANPPRSESTSSAPPPGFRAGSSHGHYSAPRQFPMPHAFTFSPPGLVPRSTSHYGHITVTGARGLHAGRQIGSMDDAMAASQGPDLHFDGFDLSGTGFTLLGDSYNGQYSSPR